MTEPDVLRVVADLVEAESFTPEMLYRKVHEHRQLFPIEAPPMVLRFVAKHRREDWSPYELAMQLRQAADDAE